MEKHKGYYEILKGGHVTANLFISSNQAKKYIDLIQKGNLKEAGKLKTFTK